MRTEWNTKALWLTDCNPIDGVKKRNKSRTWMEQKKVFCYAVMHWIWKITHQMQKNEKSKELKQTEISSWVTKTKRNDWNLTAFVKFYILKTFFLYCSNQLRMILKIRGYECEYLLVLCNHITYSSNEWNVCVFVSVSVSELTSVKVLPLKYHNLYTHRIGNMFHSRCLYCCRYLVIAKLSKKRQQQQQQHTRFCSNENFVMLLWKIIFVPWKLNNNN